MITNKQLLKRILSLEKKIEEVIVPATILEYDFDGIRLRGVRDNKKYMMIQKGKVVFGRERICFSDPGFVLNRIYSSKELKIGDVVRFSQSYDGILIDNTFKDFSLKFIKKINRSNLTLIGWKYDPYSFWEYTDVPKEYNTKFNHWKYWQKAYPLHSALLAGKRIKNKILVK